MFDRLAEIESGSVDLVVTSPPFLALRSYLPADHVHKHREIGSESTPAGFLDTLLELSGELGRVLASHGSLCVELGDTYSGGGGDNHLYEGSNKAGGFNGSAAQGSIPGRRRDLSSGWPLVKSLTGIPTLYPWCLAYGRNLLTGVESPAGQWRIRNVIVWGRPNPPVGALGDKFRPATSYITVACRGARRYFDLDAVRTEAQEGTYGTAGANGRDRSGNGFRGVTQGPTHYPRTDSHPGGAPPLDWHTDQHPEDGDWLWRLPTQPYAGSHYATFPLTLPRRLIEAMCPLRVCTTCGKPSERITGETSYQRNGHTCAADAANFAGLQGRRNSTGHSVAVTPTLGWSDCGHDTWRTGIVLDPFAGSGTTLEAAQLVGRHAIGIDLDERNADLARDRVGMFLEIDGAH